MKIQRLNEELFTPMEQNEMMVILGGGKTVIREIFIESTKEGTDTHVKTLKYKQQD